MKNLTLTAPENVFKILKDCVTRCKDGQSMEVTKTLLQVHELLDQAEEVTSPKDVIKDDG